MGESPGVESSEDERTIPPVENFVDEGNREDEDIDDLFESSQDFTQLVPRTVIKEEPESPKKKKDKSKDEPSRKHVNGYKIREVDVSEIPAHAIANMARIVPNDSDVVEGLTTDEIEESVSSKKGGVWILQCPKDVSLSNLLTGKKLSLDGASTLLEDNDDDESLELTQYLPTDSLGVNVKNRKYEAVSIKNEDCKNGMLLLLPNNGSFKAVTAPINGHIVIRESVQELSLPTIDVEKPKPRLLPSGIKERHPVYGADFSNILKEMEAAIEQSPKKKKKKSRKAVAEEIVEETSCSWKSIKPKQNGFMNEEEVPFIQQEALNADEDTPRKKKKKKKHAEDDFDNYVHPDITNGNVNGDFNYNEDDNEDHNKRKKKSKKRKREEEAEEFVDLDKTEVLLTTNHSKKSKKAKYRE